ncbi:MAG: hypothetical protein WC695_01180 [Candidatus Omnitrophota bacterium]
MRLSVVALIFLFFIWILPLGVFIKPSQEKLVCGGQRAICLCGSRPGQTKTAPTQQRGCLQIKVTTSEEDGVSGSGAGNYYLAANLSGGESLNAFTFEHSTNVPYLEPFLKSIEHVPKASDHFLNSIYVKSY